MAEKQFWVGNSGPFFYEDTTDYAFKTEGQLEVQTAPTSPNEVARLSDLPTVSGHSGNVTVITNAQINAGALEVKTKTLTIANGLVSSVGAESGWTATPL